MGRSVKRSPVVFCHEYGALRYCRARLSAIGRRVYRRESVDTNRQATVILCDDATIRSLNARYRTLDRATDVLSFCYDDPDLLGEIYISLPRCKEQCTRFGTTYSEEVERVFVHGMMHLLGFDHGTASQRRRMQAKEREYREVRSAE
jgi:probable rRNA maturation factor